MSFVEQFEFIEYFSKKKLSEKGESYSQKRAADLLGTTYGKYQAWSKGQYPSIDELQHLVRNFNFNPDWLLLEIGAPIQIPLDKPFNKELVEICDTLHDLVYSLGDPVVKIAEIGGLTTQDLKDCMGTQKTPPVHAIAKWILHYKINANFLLAQIGKPLLTEEQFLERGPLDDIVRKKRGDYEFLNCDDEDDLDYQEPQSSKQNNLNAESNILKKYEQLFEKYEATLKENADLREKLASITGEVQVIQKEA